MTDANRIREIHEKEREINKCKKYDFRGWLRAFVIPSGKKGMNYLLVAGGDVRSRMNLGYSDLVKNKCSIVSIDGVPHTVITISDGFLALFKRARDFKAFYKLVTNYIADEDIRKFHYALWLAAHNMNAKISRLAELQKRSVRKPTETERAVFANTSVRASARHYNNF